jgi:hypothetical protein
VSSHTECTLGPLRRRCRHETAGGGACRLVTTGMMTAAKRPRLGHHDKNWGRAACSAPAPSLSISFLSDIARRPKRPAPYSVVSVVSLDVVSLSSVVSVLPVSELVSVVTVLSAIWPRMRSTGVWVVPTLT